MSLRPAGAGPGHLVGGGEGNQWQGVRGSNSGGGRRESEHGAAAEATDNTSPLIRKHSSRDYGSIPLDEQTPVINEEEYKMPGGDIKTSLRSDGKHYLDSEKNNISIQLNELREHLRAIGDNLNQQNSISFSSSPPNTSSFNNNSRPYKPLSSPPTLSPSSSTHPHGHINHHSHLFAPYPPPSSHSAHHGHRATRSAGGGLEVGGIDKDGYTFVSSSSAAPVSPSQSGDYAKTSSLSFSDHVDAILAEESAVGSIYRQFTPLPSSVAAGVSSSSVNISRGDPTLNSRQSSRAVIEALKVLQDKIRALEAQREYAEQNYADLDLQSSRYRMKLDNEVEAKKSKELELRRENEELEGALKIAEARARSLHKEMQVMRTRMDRSNLMTGTNGNGPSHRGIGDVEEAREAAQLEQERDREWMDGEVEKRRMLKKVVLKKANEKNLSGDWGEYADEEVSSDNTARQRKSGKKASGSTRTTSTSVSRTKPLKKPSKMVDRNLPNQYTKHGKSNSSAKGSSSSPSMTFNRPVPFVVGKSTGPSFSVSANVQRVLSLLKSCKPVYDGGYGGGKTNGRDGGAFVKGSGAGKNSKDVDGNKSPVKAIARKVRLNHSERKELARILRNLEDEFGYMTLEYHELMSQIDEDKIGGGSDISYERCAKIERQIDAIVANLEEKGEQIRRLKKYYEYHSPVQSPNAGRKHPGTSKRSKSQVENYNASRNMSPSHHHSHNGGLSFGGEDADQTRKNKELLRGMKHIQASLEQELNWRP
eukprot:Nk52_evm13s159 gene=Nk52_evmTU13s159